MLSCPTVEAVDGDAVTVSVGIHVAGDTSRCDVLDSVAVAHELPEGEVHHVAGFGLDGGLVSICGSVCGVAIVAV